MRNVRIQCSHKSSKPKVAHGLRNLRILGACLPTRSVRSRSCLASRRAPLPPLLLLFHSWSRSQPSGIAVVLDGARRRLGIASWDDADPSSGIHWGQGQHDRRQRGRRVTRPGLGGQDKLGMWAARSKRTGVGLLALSRNRRRDSGHKVEKEYGSEGAWRERKMRVCGLNRRRKVLTLYFSLKPRSTNIGRIIAHL